MHCDALLFTGTLFWSAVVALFTAFSDLDAISPYLPDWIVPEQEFLYNSKQVKEVVTYFLLIGQF